MGDKRKGHIISLETRKKISEAHIGMKHSLETRKEMSRTRKGRKLSSAHKEKLRRAGIGKTHTIESRRKMSLAKKGKPNGREGTHHTEETKKKIRESNKGCIGGMKGKKHSEETKRKMSEEAKGKKHTLESRRKMSEAQRKLWQDPIYKETKLKAMSTGLRKAPNRPEKKLRNILNHLFPGEYKFVGDGQIWIGGKNPDFMNVNGQKKLIEMFGDFWHGNYKDRTKHQGKRDRIKHFAKYEFKTLIIWERNLKDRKKLKEKLLEFCGGGEHVQN